MSETFSELVKYHTSSPDPTIPGCRNNGTEEDGVTFLGVEPLIGSDTYIGRTAMIEGIALLFGLTPAEAVEKLTRAGEFRHFDEDLPTEDAAPTKKPRRKASAPVEIS